MLRTLIALGAAIIAMPLALLAYGFVWRQLLRWDDQRLIATLLLLAICVYLFRRFRGIPSFLLFVGSVALVMAHLHDFFIQFGIEHHLFQFGGSDSYIMQGFFEPRENPLIAIPADVLRYTGFAVVIGLTWLTARVAHAHLTRRCS